MKRGSRFGLAGMAKVMEEGTHPKRHPAFFGDSTQLLFLRARYYNPADGRFQSRDTWSGDVNRPLSLNRWMYTEGNPVNATDPSGFIKKGAEAREAEIILGKLNGIYNVKIQKDWGYSNQSIPDYVPEIAAWAPTLKYTNCGNWIEGNWRSVDELYNVFNGVRATAKGMGGIIKFRTAMKNRPVQIRRVNLDGEHTPHTLPFLHIVYFNYEITNQNYINYTTIHEFGHVWDMRTGFRLSSEMSRVVDTHYCDPYAGWPCFYDATKKGKEPPVGDYAASNAREDWAESFAVYIDPNYHPNYILRPIRKQYVQDKINSIH